MLNQKSSVNQIMNAAMKEFAQRPYQEITISQICNHLPF